MVSSSVGINEKLSSMLNYSSYRISLDLGRDSNFLLYSFVLNAMELFVVSSLKINFEFKDEFKVDFFPK